jgi:hypothetical protein
MGVPRREMWIAVASDGGAMWQMDHEGDYQDGDTLVEIKPTRGGGVNVEIRPTEKGVRERV